MISILNRNLVTKSYIIDAGLTRQRLVPEPTPEYALHAGACCVVPSDASPHRYERTKPLSKWFHLNNNKKLVIMSLSTLVSL